MKLSIVREDKKTHEQHLSVKPAEWFFERIKIDTKARNIGKLREHIMLYGDTGNYEQNSTIATIYPSVEMTKTENGNLEIVAFNGLVWLHVAELMKPSDIEAVKNASKIMPTTFSAFKGADGKSVETLFVFKLRYLITFVPSNGSNGTAKQQNSCHIYHSESSFPVLLAFPEARLR